MSPRLPAAGDTDARPTGFVTSVFGLRERATSVATEVRAGLTTLTHGLPAARRRILSAIVCLRRLIVPVVQPDMWGVITTFSNWWNGNFEGRMLGSLGEG